MDRKDFSLTTAQVNGNWTNSLTKESNNYQPFDSFENIRSYELVARYAEYQALVYCAEHHITPMKMKGRVGNFEVLSKGQDERGTHHWLIIVNHEQKNVVITLRGTTSNPVEIWNDIDIRTTHLPCYMFPVSCRKKDIKVHHGFLNHFLLFGEQITNIARIYHKLYADYATVLTAHSLGAATGALLIRHWIETDLVKFDAAFLFGLPIVGNELFASTFQDKRVTKIFNENDIVPFLGYVNGKHINTPGIWVNNRTFHTDTVGHDNLDCLHLSWYPHSLFFGIHINDNYCKLNLNLQQPHHSRSQNPTQTAKTKKNLLLLILVLVLVLFIVLVYLSLLCLYKK